jgi:hypothetical protein
MRTLFVVAILFFATFGGLAAYFASQGPGNEYDLSYTLPIDTRTMPQANLPPVQGEARPQRSPDAGSQRAVSE